MNVSIRYTENNVLHRKNEKISYQSRYIREPERSVNGNTLKGMDYTSKLYNEKLSNLDESSFRYGNLKNIGKSKEAIFNYYYFN